MPHVRDSRTAWARVCIVTALALLLSSVSAHSADQFPTLRDAVKAAPPCGCKLPHHPRSGPRAGARATPVSEIEPNDTPAQAQTLPLGTGTGQSTSIAVTASLSASADADYYKVTAERGDIIAFAINSQFDSFGALTDSNGNVLMDNDDLNALPEVYPPSSPLPLPQNPKTDKNAALSYVVPTPGDYYVRITSFNAGSNGPYVLDIVKMRPNMETKADGSKQIIFIDFDGATIDAFSIFGEGVANAQLSPLANFMTKWGLQASDEPLLIDKIMAIVKSKYDKLRLASLNGDRPTDNVSGHYDIQFLNSKDNADIFGQPLVSRVIVGGTETEVNIQTIGIASSVDPGNFSTEDTALVLLDALSDPAGGGDSVNSLNLDPSVAKIDAVAIAIANVIAHEMGHFLGAFHQDPNNALNTIMDSGGGGIEYLVGTGPDLILGTGDDEDREIVTDRFDPSELTADTVTIREATDLIIAYGLSTGKAAVLGGGGPVGTSGPVFAQTAPCPSAGSIGGPNASTAIAGQGNQPIPCFTQDVGGGTGPLNVTFNPACTYLPVAPANKVYLYQAVWDFGDASPGLLVPATPNSDPTRALATVSKNFCGDTTFTVTLRIDITIRDVATGALADGPSSFTQGEVHVANTNFPPTAVVEQLSSPATGTLPYQLVVTASASKDGDGYIIWAAIDWGDGSRELITPLPPNIPTVPLTHSYAAPGIYRVTVSVIDNGRLSVGVPLPSVPSPNDPLSALAAIINFQRGLASLPAAFLDPKFNPQLSQDSILVQVPGNLYVIKGGFTLDFKRANNDKFDVQMHSNLFADSISNVNVSLTIGRGTTPLTLPPFKTDIHGRYRDRATGLQFDFNAKKQVVRIRFSHAKLAAALNVTTGTVVNGNVDVPVRILINNTLLLATTGRFVYNADAGVKGIGKNGLSFPNGN